MGEANSKHAAHRLPVRHRLQCDLLRSGLHDGQHLLLLPAPRLHDRALQGGLCYTGLVTFIAFYHYYRIFNSFDAAFTPCEVVDGVVNAAKCDPETYGYSPTGHSFNDAYRYMDWLLTVPLLLIEIVLVMKLSPEETKKQSLRLGVLSGLMILNGYPGESPGDASTRWTYWTLSMLPFCYIVYTLFYGLKESQDAQPEAVRDQVKWACWATVISWCTYPCSHVTSTAKSCWRIDGRTTQGNSDQTVR